MPQGMTLWINQPLRNLFAENTIKQPTQTPQENSGHIELRQPFSTGILCVYIILVHSRYAKETQKHIMHLEANTKTDHRMNNSESSTIEEEEGGHRTAIVPIWRVEDIHIKEHLPYHRSFIALLLPEKSKIIYKMK